MKIIVIRLRFISEKTIVFRFLKVQNEWFVFKKIKNKTKQKRSFLNRFITLLATQWLLQSLSEGVKVLFFLFIIKKIVKLMSFEF